MLKTPTHPSSDKSRLLDIRLSRDQINALAIGGYDGPTEIVRSQQHMLEAVDRLRHETLLGFDTETRPVFRKGVSHPTSLLQLAGADCVFLFQLKFLRDLRPLCAILADPAVLKAGVATRDDIKELRALCEFEPAGFIDIGNCARRSGLKHHGLRGLAALLLGFRLTKSGSRYNWARSELPAAAIRYAASDAWAGRQLYLEMKRRGLLAHDRSGQTKAPEESAG